jgi:hypothetical protein
LSLYLIRHHAKKGYEGVEVQLRVLLITVVMFRFTPAVTYSKKEAAVPVELEALWPPEAVGNLENGISFAQPGIEPKFLNCPARSLAADRHSYPDVACIYMYICTQSHIIIFCDHKL